MASLNGDATPVSGVAIANPLAPNDTYLLPASYQGTLLQTKTLLGGPQPLVLITNELTMIPSSPSVQVNEATQTHLVVHPSYCAVPGSSEFF
ncbi:hypothetical protein MRX96_008773 [Rhipicephalus microplus]